MLICLGSQCRAVAGGLLLCGFLSALLCQSVCQGLQGGLALGERVPQYLLGAGLLGRVPGLGSGAQYLHQRVQAQNMHGPILPEHGIGRVCQLGAHDTAGVVGVGVSELGGYLRVGQPMHAQGERGRCRVGHRAGSSVSRRWACSRPWSVPRHTAITAPQVARLDG